LLTSCRLSFWPTAVDVLSRFIVLLLLRAQRAASLFFPLCRFAPPAVFILLLHSHHPFTNCPFAQFVFTSQFHHSFLLLTSLTQQLSKASRRRLFTKFTLHLRALVPPLLLAQAHVDGADRVGDRRRLTLLLPEKLVAILACQAAPEALFLLEWSKFWGFQGLIIFNVNEPQPRCMQAVA
jgi:hypothetical protein